MPHYDYSCTKCGKSFTEQRSPATEDVGSAACACGHIAARAWTSVPQMIVRGSGKNVWSGDNFAPEHVGTQVPRQLAHLTPAQYERKVARECARSEAKDRAIARDKSSMLRGDGGLRRIGRCSQGKLFAMMNENGGDMPSKEQLLRHDVIHQHEKKNVQ